MTQHFSLISQSRQTMDTAPSFSPSPVYILLRDPMMGEASEQRRIRIIGITLIFSLIIAVLLITYFLKRFCIPNSSPVDGYSTSPNTSSPESKPQKDCHIQLAAFPVFIFRSQTLSPPSCSSAQSNNENCTICLDDYADGDCIRVLPRCKHMFHKDCIDLWLSSRSSHCPICRDSAIEQNVAFAERNCGNTANDGEFVVLNINIASDSMH